MARNLEIKARVADLTPIRTRAAHVASSPGEIIYQTDTFFAVVPGRLKVREFADGTGELIAYERPDQTGPKESVYSRVGCDDAGALVRILSRVLRPCGTVVKRREVFLVGRTRVHLDEVAQLGTFVELEVVLGADEPAIAGEREAQDLLERLGIVPDDLIAGAYLDLLNVL